MHVAELEEAVCDGKAHFRAERELLKNATIHVMVPADSGVEIAQQYDLVVL